MSTQAFHGREAVSKLMDRLVGRVVEPARTGGWPEFPESKGTQRGEVAERPKALPC